MPNFVRTRLLDLLGPTIPCDDDLRLIIQLVYKALLERDPDAIGEQAYIEALRGGLSLQAFAAAVRGSDEYRKKQLDKLAAASPCPVMGTLFVLSQELWDNRRKSLQATCSFTAKSATPLSARTFRHSGTIEVSAITSLYKGGRFLEAFLDNITSQTYFHRSELIIVDANSPEGEAETIARYMAVYDNIVYKRFDSRIGIYDAWNEAIRLARGRYLTSTNLDDLRRSDCFERQAKALDGNEDVDVVYQDFYYCLEPLGSFDEIARCGFQSHVRKVTPEGLLECNWPHNAPMWKARLHDEIGLFDTSFQSAGDHEFWLRCIEHNKKFMKLDEALATYYFNPDGISTRPMSRGIAEGRILQKRYSERLKHRFTALSRDV